MSTIIELMKDQEKSNFIGYSIATIVFYLISEFLPNFFALDYSFMKSYLKNENSERLIYTSSPQDRLNRITSPKTSIDETVKFNLKIRKILKINFLSL